MSSTDFHVGQASLNIVLGTAAISLVFIVLSVIPECGGVLSSQVLTFLVVQSCVHLAVLMTTTFTVSFILAADVSDIFDDWPGHILICGVIVAALMQFASSFYRMLSLSAPILALRIFSKSLVFVIILGSFLFSANRFVDSLVEKRQLNYSLAHFRWQFNMATEIETFYIVLAVAVSILSVLYITAVLKVFFDYRLRTPEIRRINKAEFFQAVGEASQYFICDLTYAALLLFARYRARPNFTNPNFTGFTLALRVAEGHVQSTLLLIWPVLCAIATYKHMRAAIGFRSSLMMSQQQMPSSRRHTVMKKISTISQSSRHIAAASPIYAWRNSEQNSHDSIDTEHV
uniref:G_PROTEIN_RECEP_F1_2 domain-containing protein n=1 Tax=Panagrellus redivivus TaxID=6233 RepID=A0A7E4WB37_PANRE